MIDSPLFECCLKVDGNLELKEVSSSDFLFAAHVPDHIGCRISVVTKHELSEFACSSKQLANAIREDLNEEQRK